MYIVSDGNSIEKVKEWSELVDIIIEWYEFLGEDGTFESCMDVPEPDGEIYDLEEGDVDGMNRIITAWENEIAEAAGHEEFHGHGSYHVSAASEMGLNLTVRIEDP